jgi:hypothetical protein
VAPPARNECPENDAAGRLAMRRRLRNVAMNRPVQSGIGVIIPRYVVIPRIRVGLKPGMYRVTRGGACKHTNGDGDHSPYIVATFAFFLIFNGNERTQHF